MMSERLRKLRLSERAMLLLLLIDQETERDWTNGQFHHYWIPGDRYKPVHIYTLNSREITVGGASDARILKSLESKGLIERPKGTPDGYPYAYGATEDGRLASEDIYSHLLPHVIEG